MAKSKKSLAETHPELAKEWHPTKNEFITPNDVTPGSGKKVWWKCEMGEDHEWQSLISNRLKGSGCPVCSGRMAVLSNCLATLNPNLAQEWHPSKNKDLTPFNVKLKSNKKVWWKCEKQADHEWLAPIAHRSNGTKCPYCTGNRVIQSNSLASINPVLAKEWHPVKNDNLKPSEVTPNSNKKVWWKCHMNHSWEATVGNRNSGRGCPVCSGRKAIRESSLASEFPILTKELHPFKNGSVLGTNLRPGSQKKVWWKCDAEDDHEWEATVSSRTRGNGCPFCAGQKACKSNSLEALYPDIARQWHPNKNKISPREVTPGSRKMLWWKCNKGDDHEWQATVSQRVLGTGCSVCSNHKIVNSNSLATLNPELAGQWHPTKNNLLTTSDVGIGSHQKVWWKCDKGVDHEWEASVSDRTNGNGCPICSGKKVVQSNSLGTLNPELALQWHPTKNGQLTPFDLVTGSNKKVWWKCDKGDDHEWIAPVNNRSKGAGCSVCSNHKIVNSNSLATLNPELAGQWHPTKNNLLTTSDVGIGSHQKVWWKCDKGVDHEWEASVSDRTNGNGCPICSGKKVVQSNSLGTLNPELALQWHPTKNGQLTPFDLVTGSNKKVWWKCDKGDDHEWQTTPNHRTNRGSNCPFCTLTPQSKQELTITFELRTIFPKINPKGFKTRLKGRQRAIDIFIPQLNLCIEFDGSYWHKGKREIDKIKSNLLLKEGYGVIRVREEPLKKIYDTDVISKQPYDGKQVTNHILSMILSLYDLDSELVQRIIDYQSKGDLQNEKGLNKYIDKILKEKAEKK